MALLKKIFHTVVAYARFYADVNDNNSYIMTIIDPIRPMLLLFHCKRKKKKQSQTSSEVFLGAEKLRYCTETMVENLLTQELKLFANLLVKFVQGGPYRPQSQGKVERFNGTLRKMISKKLSKASKCIFNLTLPYVNRS